MWFVYTSHCTLSSTLFGAYATEERGTWSQRMSSDGLDAIVSFLNVDCVRVCVRECCSRISRAHMPFDPKMAHVPHECQITILVLHIRPLRRAGVCAVGRRKKGGGKRFLDEIIRVFTFLLKQQNNLFVPWEINNWLLRYEQMLVSISISTQFTETQCMDA